MNQFGKHRAEALERRPEARAFKVEDLLLDVSRGRVRVPPFQRGLRWNREDARKLLDSIYRGYPVGTLLFWEKAAEAGEIRLGSLRISGESRSDALWVVDGQQRIVSLARVLLAEAPAIDEFALFFDLDSQWLEPPPETGLLEQDPGRWLPMTQVLDAERLMHWLFEHAADRKERRERAIQLGKRIRDYEIPAYLVRTDNEAILREVFGRINSSGKKLKADEVFDALHGSYRQSSPATLKEVAQDLDALGFGHVEEEKVLYRLLLATQGRDDVRRAGESQFRLSPREAAAAYLDTELAARRAIRFIREEVGIPHYDLLPYKQPLVALGKFFHHYQEPTPRSRELLARWVWRGALSGAHRGDTASAQSTLSRIGRQDEEASVQRLLEQVGGSPSLPPAVEPPFNFRSATSKLQALALLALNPLDLETGEPIDPQSLGQQEKRGGLSLPQVIGTNDHRPLSQSVANRLFHPGRAGLRRLALAVTDPRIALSHGISTDAMEALRSGDVGRFLERRAAWLAEHFTPFFARHARWGESDRPSLDSLLIADDDEAQENPQ